MGQKEFFNPKTLQKKKKLDSKQEYEPGFDCSLSYRFIFRIKSVFIGITGGF